MPYEQRDNSGSLFKNENKTEDKHPGMQGKAMIDGVMYYISAWKKDGQKGPWQSLSFKRVEDAKPAAKASPKPANQRVSTPDHFDDEDFPF